MKELDDFLNKHGLEYHQPPLSNQLQAEKLLQAYAVLEEAGVECDAENKRVYEWPLLNGSLYYVDQLTQACRLLIDIGVKYNPEHKWLYDLLFSGDCLYYAGNLSQAFCSLIEAGVACSIENKWVYESLVAPQGSTKNLLELFKILKLIGCQFTAVDQERCKTIITQPKMLAIFFEAVELLQESGIDSDQSNQALYQAVIERLSQGKFIGSALEYRISKNYRLVTDLNRVLKTLNADGYQSSQASQFLYCAVIKEFEYAADLIQGFKTLESAGFVYASYPYVYQQLEAWPYSANKLALMYQQVKEEVVALDQQSEWLYLLLAKAGYSAPGLGTAYQLIKEVGVECTHDNKWVYVSLSCLQPMYMEKVAQAYGALIKVGIECNAENKWLYESFSFEDNLPHIDQLSQAYQLLKVGGVDPLPENHFLYQALAAHPENSEELAAVFVLLKKIEFPLDGSIYFDVILNSTDRVLSIVRQLNQAGHHYKATPFVYEVFLKYIKQSGDLNYSDIRCLNQLCDYARNNNFSSLATDVIESEHQLKLRELVNENMAPELTCGPLNKTKATRLFESLLEDIASIPIEEIYLAYDSLAGYTLKLPNKEKINLTLLLKDANLSHLTLSDALVASLGRKIPELRNYDFIKKVAGFVITEKLPAASEHAVACYVSEKHKHINQFYRGEALEESDPRYTWITPVYGSENLLVNFICGALVNDAANRLNVLVWQDERRQQLVRLMNRYEIHVHELRKQPEYESWLTKARADDLIDEETHIALVDFFKEISHYFPFHASLDRREILSDELIIRRKANPQFLPAITSFSASEGAEFIRGSKDHGSTKMQAIGLHYPVICPEAVEVIIPHGEQMIYTQNASGTFYAALVRSPSLEQRDHYVSHLALLDAYQGYLSKPYLDNQHSVLINSKTVERPNHGLAHTFRVMENIVFVTDYFAHYASDSAFKLFCQTMSGEALECLRVAAAFSVTGRESEVSARADLERYMQYRANSAAHFREFVGMHQFEVFSDPAMRERISHVIHHMGNPAYENPEGRELVAINVHEDPKERECRNYFHRILNIAHKLDLSRCYGPDQFKEAISVCLDLSQQGELQRAGFNQMVGYNIALLKAHGNTLATDISADGELIPCERGLYASPFEEVSLLLKRLFEISDTVTRLQLTEKYQFSQVSADDSAAHARPGSC